MEKLNLKMGNDRNVKYKLITILDPEFDHEYMATANITLTRHRRDGGLVSGPVATAIVTGMIGMTAKAVQDITAYHPYPSQVQ